MSRYSYEYKLKVVEYYNEKMCTYEDCCKKFNIKSISTIYNWVNKYNTKGEKGLNRKINKNYTGEFKQSVLEYMHENKLSAIEASRHFNIEIPSVVYDWERVYRKEGFLGLYREKRGRKQIESSKDIIEEIIEKIAEPQTIKNIEEKNIIEDTLENSNNETLKELLKKIEALEKENNDWKTKAKSSEDKIRNLEIRTEDLKIENEYLKKLEALVQKRIKR